MLSYLKKLKNLHLNDRMVDMYNKLEQAGIIGWPVQATALSYYCILGVLPFLALCFALARTFGLEEILSKTVNGYFSSLQGQEQAVLGPMKTIVEDLISNFFANYSGSLMVFVALGVIFWSGYRILTLLEAVFGSIFGYHPPRRVIHRIMDYFTVMVIVPLVLVAGVTVNFYLTGLLSSRWDIPWSIDPSRFASVFVIISPYLMWWLLLSWAYAYFSRGLVRWRERLLGGFIAGLVFQMFQVFYLRIMFALTSYSAIYLSFAAIPLFMIWLYTGWVIVLGGGELTRRLSDFFATGRNLFSLVIPATWCNTLELTNQVMHELIKNYQAEPVGGPTSFRQLSRATGAPMPALGAVINRLLAVDLVVRISGPTVDEGPSFLPARSPGQLTDEYVREALEAGPVIVYN